MQLALAFFFGCRGQIAAGKAISQQLNVIGQRNVRAAAVGGVHIFIVSHLERVIDERMQFRKRYFRY